MAFTAIDMNTTALSSIDGQESDNAAFYYPIGTKMQLKPHRNKALAQLGLSSQRINDSVEKPDAWDIEIRDPDDEEVEQRAAHVRELEVE